MSITERVQRDMTAAMKAKDKQRLSALRMILSELKLAAKEAPDRFGETQETALLMRERKKRLQSAEAFRKGGREDRARQEEAEAVIIDEYLPRALSEDELMAMVDEAIRSTGAGSPRDMGRVMSALMPRIAGRADGGAVSGMVKARLAG